ncbi:MAG: hypothetical protein ACREAB_09360 [Blastocatellia bacterium]
MLITSVKPNITREQAVAKFRGGFSQLRHGRLRIAVDFYLPYRFFQLTWDNGRRSADTILAADAVTGKLDLIEFSQLPEDGNRMSVDTQMIVEERVNEEEAYRLVRERVMRLVFMKGFFKLSRVNVEIDLAASLHLPYWVGVYERQGRARLEIINALQGRFEGAKLRELVSEWFQPRQT